mmetsp:Transcript_20720/g.61814  ORF Transcript_20720/g.61814 Transcript_20720/m.61814 type:complete len:99 (+) Transcript_20720:2521-2817(+)
MLLSLRRCQRGVHAAQIGGRDVVCGALIGDIPNETKISINVDCQSLGILSIEQTACALVARCDNNPHGAPSGVCAGQRNPQESGRSFRTLVVFIVVKN